jgi:curved DNA-binding protein CbpA
VRIPLDYYRILGLPIQATAEQLQQAHRDRTLQLPRREFSEVAIAARRQLLDRAYTVLSDVNQRQEYDANFLAKSYDLAEVGRSSEPGAAEPAAEAPYFDSRSEFDESYAVIDIDSNQLVGALLILLDLGEYELVLKHSAPYLDHNNFALKQGQLGEPEIVSADITLIYALACLELGREQWQQGQYESAAESLQSGQASLLRAGLFSNLRGEMQSDLYKLRPYRILELVALPELQIAARQQGLDLLREMLHDRHGIDGSGDDQSGLAVDDFLRFIQQLRSYLTASEQQTLFETEARRPSAVAVYLAVYALLARGFAERQPALIRRSKSMLMQLSVRQDVHLEQAVCALLLGQTEEASRALELSQEFESIAFIREHSQGSPDLLPGLCLYSERWLQNEVFPHFRDLAHKQASLKEYFADEDVQLYLEELPNEPEPVLRGSQRGLAYRSPDYDSRRFDAPPVRGGRDSGLSPMSPLRPSARVNSNGATATDPIAPFPTDRSEDEFLSSGSRSSHRSRPQSAIAPGARRGTLRLDRVLLLAAVGAGVLFLGYLLTRLFDRPQAATSAAEATTEQVRPLSPVLATVIEQQSQASTTPADTLDETSAAAVIESWLTAKAEAMGEEHAIDRLSEVLADPALSSWQERAEQLEASDSYWTYDHSGIEVSSVQPLAETEQETAATGEASPEVSPEAGTTPGSNSAATEDTAENRDNADPSTAAPNAAIVEAVVTERGDFYDNGQLDQSSSYESTLQVQYNFVQQDGEWRIQDWQVLE